VDFTDLIQELTDIKNTGEDTTSALEEREMEIADARTEVQTQTEVVADLLDTLSNAEQAVENLYDALYASEEFIG
jgi:chromosome segregation ATPase